MSDFRELTEKFKKFNKYQKLIDTMVSKDIFEFTFTMYEMLCSITLSLPMVKKPEPKSDKFSQLNRTSGNSEFAKGEYGTALQLYNMACLHAPLGSRNYINALSNRSALFQKISKFSSALRDIETCLTLNCPVELKRKLIKRKEECQALSWQEDIKHTNVFGEFNDAKVGKDFFQVTGKRNPKFPYAKNSIDIVARDGKETVVAQSDIKVGEVVAVEPSYVMCNVAHNFLLFCDHCNKYTDNLIPCPTCVLALYCDETCKNQSWEEFHGIECAMSEIVDMLPTWYQIWLTFVLKTWNKCRDLEKFSMITEKMERLLHDQEGSYKLELNDIGSYLLPPRKGNIMKHGKLYDSALFTSFVIHGLENVPRNVLKTTDKNRLIKHIAKQVMYHVMHSPSFQTSGAFLPLDDIDIIVNSVEATGFFPLMSRMESSCIPNMLTVGLGNKMALVCVTPIKAGSTLTFAYGGDFHNTPKKERQITCYDHYGFVCDCQPCRENWKEDDAVKETTPRELTALIHQFQWVKSLGDRFSLLCEKLTDLKGKPKSKEYQYSYTCFRQFISMYQYAVTQQRFDGDVEALHFNSIRTL